MVRSGADAPFVPFACIGLSILCFQFGAALATMLFASVGAQGASALRLGLAAVILLAATRPWRERRAPSPWLIGYGLGLAGLNLFFYLAIRTLPLGLTVAIEFLGPLSLAVFTSRRRLDALWAALAGLGMLSLAPFGAFDAVPDPAGVGFALCSAVSWVAYIICGKEAGKSGLGPRTAALGVTVAALAVLPFGILHAGTDLLRPDLWPLALTVAVVSGCLPYVLELVAMKQLPTRVFGILMSLEPAAGTLFGYLILGQHLTLRQGLAIGAVVLASAGSSFTSRSASPAAI